MRKSRDFEVNTSSLCRNCRNKENFSRELIYTEPFIYRWQLNERQFTMTCQHDIK